MNIYVENINDIIHETSVDFVIRPCSREIHIVQYDKELPVIKVNLFREGQPYQLPNSALVHVRLGKLDNTFVYTNILGMNEDRTIAYFEVTEQMAMIAGRVNPVIEVVYQGKVACSSPIPFVISKNPVQEGQIESHDEFPIIYQLESDVEEHNEWLRKYTALTEFDGFVEGESVWDGIAEGEIKYCQSGSQTEDVPSENTVIKIDLSQQHLSKAESKALYIKKIIINYTPDGQTEKTYEYTFNSRIFGRGTALPTIEPEYADLTDGNSGITLRWYLNYLLQEGVSDYFGNYNGTKGQQFGSNNNPPALISLSTSGLENCTVNSIYVEVSSNGGTQAKCKLTIVNDVWTCNNIPDPQITSNNAQYKWLHEPNGTHLGSSSGGQVIHHYNHVFLNKENGKVTEVQPDPALQYVLNDYSATYKYSTADNLLHQIGPGGGLPEATKAGQVLVSNEDLKFEERDAVPMADNLTSAPETNDTMYSAGPTGGLADIQTGEKSYLQEIKGYSIVWNQLLDANHGHTCVSGHYYIYYNGSSFSLIGPSSTASYSKSSKDKLFDLTLMFGGNDKIPFSLVREIEYPANGDMPIQNYYAQYGFQRFFANVDLYNTPYDAGTIKNVKTSKLTETGQNLYDSATMNGISPLLLAGYRYEIYFINGTTSTQLSVSTDGVHFRTAVYMSRYKLGNGKYIYTYTPEYNCYVKCGLGNTSNPIVYVGFVHSGNYCLTTGNNTNSNSSYTDATIPAYQKHEFTISDIDGLNGIPDSSENHCSIYDTKDVTRIGSLDLSILEWTTGTNTFRATISNIKPSTTQLLATKYIGSEMSVDENGVITITTNTSPTGTLLYELAEPISTGKPAFEPIPLKDSQGNWVVNDMGFEYFTGLDICPVNQVSYYYENLKDKLTNLQVPEIKSIDFNVSNTQLEGLFINGTPYKLVRQGICKSDNSIALGGGNTGNYTNSISIGYRSYINHPYCVSLGSLSMVNATYGVAIGSNSYIGGMGAVAIGSSNNNMVGSKTVSSGEDSVAIGFYASNWMNHSFTCDGYNSMTYQKIYHCYSPEYIFFRNDYSKNYESTTSYTAGHKLSEYIQNNTMVSDGAKYYISYTDTDNYKTFTGNKATGTFTAIDKLINGVHITVILTDNDTTPTWHNIVGMDLMLYDSTNSLPYNSYARIDCGGTVEDIIAYIDADGCVVITAPTGTVISSVKYNIK